MRGDSVGYRVEYRPCRQANGYQKRILRVSVLSVLFLILFCILVNRTWPHGADMLQQFLFSEELVVSASALENMAQEICSGERVSDAFAALLGKIAQIFRG